MEQRLIAVQWLADRGWGRAKELIEITGDQPATPEQRLALLRRLSDEERATLRALLAKALATPESGPSVPSAVDERQAPLEPLDDANAPLETGAPATLGRPRNVGRAIAQALELPDLEVASPAEAPALAPDSPPLPPD